ncbi:nucleotidyltransferase family protein [Winogradskyella sp.]|uniref:nucleotidyltransferase family protein n=1 Tax=Winogradskyella sp. TaxID=1883156 RepID=UPI00262F2697|nr:nucleotidyltransferase family protein [Winogradskyella sp.]
MGNLAETYQHIADILSFETSKSELSKKLNDPAFNWDDIVVEGSRHLVLPAIYCCLKSKGLIHVLPDDLNSYLKKITSINRNRNTSIIEQINTLSKLFNEHRINHVFLKGSAIITAGFFNDSAERMIGDIDILVDEKQLDLAYNLLKSENYYAIEQTLSDKFFEHKHLPRLKTDKHICCVELHRRLFVSERRNDLTSKKILLDKQKVSEVLIPSNDDLIRHNILNYQIDDQGYFYNSINFRSAYDTIVMMKKVSFNIDTHTNKRLRNYFNIIGIFFKDVLPVYTKNSFSKRFYLFKLKHTNFYKIWNKHLKIRNLIWTSISRIPYFITNKRYRKAIYDDRKRIFSILKSVFKN